jgi:outer membrane protein
MKSKSISILLLFFFVNLSFAQNQLWTLEQCLQYAVENNISIKQSMINVQVNEESRKQAEQSIIPNLNASASYINNFGLYIDPFTNEIDRFSRTQNANFGVNSSVAIFEGMTKYHNIESARLDAQAAMLDYDDAINDISLQISSTYLLILFNKEQLRVADEQLNVTSLQVERTSKLVEAGSVPQGDLYQIQAQYASEEQRKVAAEIALQNSLLQLAQLLQLEDYQSFDVVVPELELRDETLLKLTPQQIYDVAVEKQPDVQASSIRVESSRHNMAAAKGSYYPSLNLSVGASTGASDRISDSFPQQWNDNIATNVNFSLRIPIYNRRQIRSTVSRSHLTYLNNQLNKDQVENTLLQNIQSAYNDALAARKQFEADVKSVQALTESFKYTEERYNVGVVNSFDYNNSKNDLTRAESSLVRSKYDYIFKVMILEFYYSNEIKI